MSEGLLKGTLDQKKGRQRLPNGLNAGAEGKRSLVPHHFPRLRPHGINAACHVSYNEGFEPPLLLLAQPEPPTRPLGPHRVPVTGHAQKTGH